MQLEYLVTFNPGPKFLVRGDLVKAKLFAIRKRKKNGIKAIPIITRLNDVGKIIDVTV
jgi:hypothetical protein